MSAAAPGTCGCSCASGSTATWGSTSSPTYGGFPAEEQFHRIDLDTGRAALPDGAGGVVAAVETIEHLENSRAFVRELARLARLGGLVLVTTPNQVSLLSKLTLVLRDQFSTPSGRAPGCTRRTCGTCSPARCGRSTPAARRGAFEFAPERLDSRLARSAASPLQVLHPRDEPLTRITGYPYLSVGVVDQPGRPRPETTEVSPV